LRELAKQVAAAAADPVQEDRVAMWRRHNALERVRPMVLVFPEGAWRELLPQADLTTESSLARDYERDLRTRLYYAEHLHDDNVIEPVVVAPIVVQISDWGFDLQRTAPEQSTGAYHIDPVIHSEADVDRIRTPCVTIDKADTARRLEFVQDVFGDLLHVEQRGRANYGFAPLDFYAQLRGLNSFFMDLVDNPAMVHKAIGRIVDAHLSIVRDLQSQGALSLGNRNQYVGSGGVGYTDELPAEGFDGVHVRPSDLWGFATAQIFSEVSPAMHEEFALQHEKRLLELFGLNCYGCCEPLHHKLDAIFRHVPRLRRVSIAPWADVEKSATQLGKRCVFSWKPNPAIVAGETWNPDTVRKDLHRFCEQTRDCVVEMILKDTHTCRNDPRRMWEWVNIAREVADRY